MKYIHILLITCLLSGHAHADFALLHGQIEPQKQDRPETPSPPRTKAARPIAAAKTGSLNSAADTLRRREGPPSAAFRPIVQGFGDNVPLAFAVKQIVPAELKVVYADGVDQNALVRWRGGRGWKPVLRSAVIPIGLTLHIHPHALTIASASKSQ